MTVTLTQKLLENRRKTTGKQESIADVAKKVSLKMATSLNPKSKNAKHDDEEDGAETDKDRNLNDNKGPPGFYEDDLRKYYAKFDGSRKAR